MSEMPNEYNILIERLRIKFQYLKIIGFIF